MASIPPAPDAVAELLGRGLFGIKLGLDNIRALCDALDHPERASPAVIVAGTNGKGSVAAMVSAALVAGGYRTGRYTSPHLVRVEERFALDGRPVSHAALDEAARAVLDAETACRREGALAAPATFFELATATAFELFRRARAEISILEVGLGGRFDATNVATPVVGAITGIDYDHMAYLGDTLQKIAADKAGVLKPGMTAVIGERRPELVEVFSDAARSVGATLLRAFDGVRARVEIVDGVTWLDLDTPSRSYGRIPLALRGRHQGDNAIIAVRTLEALEPHGFPLPGPALTVGLTGARWPGRLEVVALDDGRRVLLDAAHNPAGAASLASYVLEAWPGRRVPVIFGVMRDKDAGPMLRALAPAASRLVFTRVATSRAASTSELTELAGTLDLGVPTLVADTPEAALAQAFTHDTIVVVTGSILLVGEAMPLVGRDEPFSA